MSNTIGLQPHHIAKNEMIEINEQTTSKVKYPKIKDNDNGDLNKVYEEKILSFRR